MPPSPDAHAIGVMLLTGFALVVFAQERFRIETSSLFIFVLLVAGLHIFPYTGDQGRFEVSELLFGFGNEALVAVCTLMILGKGLETTGALEPVARLLTPLWRRAPSLSMFVTMLAAALCSGFVNNTPIVVMLLPLLVGVSMSLKRSASRVLLPFGFATIIGGSVTTIGTSTNLLVVGVARDLGVASLGMFDFALPMALVGFAGVVFLWFFSGWLLPDRKTPLADVSLRLFSAKLRVGADSKIAGKSLADVRGMMQGEMRLLDVRRGALTLVRLPELTFVPGDELHVLDTPSRLKEMETLFGAPMHAVDTDSDEDEDENVLEEGAEDEEGEGDDVAPPRPDLDESERQRLIEIVVTEQSVLNNSTIRRERFADEYGLYVLAIHRGTIQQEVQRNAVADLVLGPGDVLLVQGTIGDIARLKDASTGLLVLDSVIDLPNTEKAPLAFGIMVGVVFAAATGLLPIAVSGLAGVVTMLMTRCLSWKATMRALSIQVVMVIVTSLALGTALIETGGAEYIATVLLTVIRDASPTLILVILMLMMTVLTNVLSNNAAGIIGTPIAVSVATQLGLSPMPFVIAIIAGVNLSFSTPMAYQTNLLVMHAGGYRFLDFARLGLPLTLFMLLGYALVIPRFFPI